MIINEMKLLIKYAIELDISSLESKVGYKGATILRLSSTDQDTIDKIKIFCQNSDIECNVNYNKTKVTTDIFCIFDTKDIYELM